jgi:carbon-monoxide dehydrogenase small subunit
MPKKHQVSATINGDVIDFLCEPQQSMLDVLRDELEMTGTKEGCATGDCGACSITVDGVLVCSCLMLGVEAEGKSIQTIEGMASGESLHVLQRKFIEHTALQCGICTPGLLIAARNLLERNQSPTEEEVRYWLAGNLCRCTGYNNVIDAVMDAAKEMRGA